MTPVPSDDGRSDDGRHIVIGGRRWRASDPAIPERLRAELVAELMDARRAVQAHRPAARVRVNNAKIALGERGQAWWDEPTVQGRMDRAAATVRALLQHRRPDSTICPSDVARVVGGANWRTAMDDVRTVVAEFQAYGIVRVTQRGAGVDLGTARGPVRIARGPKWD